MDLADFDYDLPDERIAQHPIEPRDAAKLLVDHGPGHRPEDRQVCDLAELLGPGDVVVVNHTRVLPARLHLVKPTGGAVEVLLLEPDPTHSQVWEALVRPSRKVAPGTLLTPAGDDAGLGVEVGDDLGEGRRLVQVRTTGMDLLDALDRYGEVPLPPYITETLDDPERYQTVFADRPGSVASPTAGLHLTTELLARIEANGVPVHPVELVVGLGTFRPITADRVEDHRMHAERYQVPAETMAACRDADRVVAIGTTVTRALESAATSGERCGRTDLFIHGDHDWKVVDALLTNFHIPRSSLLVMVDAFVGPRWRDLYRHALDHGYRFLSFGDAMFLQRGGR
ncbi:MAG: tRNA preQ1(34) S-adenosylmethionine ribosyltransferase-isomerase QueA [Acidimicrobiales bacterium]|nr:tRNA preQ1(34) S-adenosylmethionine ribosyltransferase-isomerase QueA [Acidimicrobiales bacterium]